MTVALIFIAMSAIALALFLWPGAAGKRDEGPVEKITVGVANVVSTALFDIAAARGLFKDQGLDVEIISYATGVEAADGLLNGMVDAATATEFVFINKHAIQPDVRLLASIARPQMHEVIARRDRGITEPGHLKGKRIAVTRYSSGDFFLETFLAHQGIPAGSITTLDLAPSGILEAVSSGTVDAAMAWEPTAGKIKERLGSNAVYWPGQSGQAYYLVLMTRDDFIKKRFRALERLLRALIEAEDYATGHASEAQDILARRPGYDRPSLQSLWSRCDFRVRLDQDLLILMESEAGWAIRNKRQKPEMPNYLDVIHWKSLQMIKPEAVSIIH
jgi:NitT/TauT family transport system substrate-binding protein